MPRRMFLVSKPARSRAVYLTFDDGPHPVHTPHLLDILREHGIQASFFIVGKMASQHPEIVRRMADEGHTIANHSWSHGEPSRVSASALLSEVKQTGDLLRQIVGKMPKLFRPPNGKLTLAKLWRLWLAGWTVVLWSRDSKD
ncbi:MAG: polysaccharide deacetylase family protein, partial [Candidatus Acidiferrum sp.]